MAKTKAPILVTPKGSASFAHLHEPDTKGEYADNKYKVTILLPKGDGMVEQLVQKINAAHDEARGKKKTESPVKCGDEWYEAADDDETREKREYARGHYRLTFKSQFQPQLMTSAKTALPEGLEIRGGDLIKVAFAMNPYDKGKNAGVSLQLRAVQLIQKRNSGGDYSGLFDDESDGEEYEGAGNNAGDDDGDSDF